MARRAAENSDTQRASLGDRDSSANNSSNQPPPAKDGNNSLTQKLRSIFANPPSTYNFEPYHESRARIRRIAEEHGYQLVSPIGSEEISGHQSADSRRICESLGVDIIYYRGGPEEDLGFTSRANPELIFLNVSSAHTTVPMVCTFAHELLHVAQKDASSGGRELGSKIESLLTSEELAAFHTAFATELPAFLTGDAISGDNVFGLDRLQNAGQIRQAITDFFDGLGKLTPSSLDSADDSELAALPPLGAGPRKINGAPEVVALTDPFPDTLSDPSQLRNHFWKNFAEITKGWPAVIRTPEGPIAWSKSKAGNKLRSFKTGEPAQLHYIAAAHLPQLLANSKLATVHTEAKGDQSVAEIHRRYAWANFPNGQRRHVLLTVERMSDLARPELQDADQAYSAEILGISLQVLPEHKDADVVNLKEPHPETGIGNQAITPAQGNLPQFLAGIKPEHQYVDQSYSYARIRPGSGKSPTNPADKAKPKENAKTRKAAERKKIHDEHHRTPPPDPTKKWSQEFYEETARQATVNPDSDTVVLGKYRHPDGRVYTKVAGQRGATYFKVENWKEVTAGMNRKQIFEINRSFLKQQYDLGKEFIFSHDPFKADGFLLDEVEYLDILGLEFKEQGWIWRAHQKTQDTPHESKK
jgi:hypothetical protein